MTWEALRWTNVALSMVAVGLLIAGTMFRWDEMPARLRRIAPWVVCTYAIIAYGSGEAAATDAEPGLRILFLALNLVGLLIALLYRFGHETDR